MSLFLYFCILDIDDIPLLQLPLASIGDDIMSVALVHTITQNELPIVHQKSAALPSGGYLKQIDKINSEWTLSAFITIGHHKLILLHPIRLDESVVRHFLNDAHGAFVSAYLSPFSHLELNANGTLERSILEAARKLTYGV